MLPFLPALIGGVGGLIAGAEGSSKLSEAEQKSMEMIQKTINEYQAIGIPPEEALKISLQESKQMGWLTPNLENIINQNPTEMFGVNTDPRLRDAQLAAMNEFRQVGENGGMRLSDIANYEKSLSDVAQRERGARERIDLDAAERGASTGGSAIASKLLNQQSDSDQRHMDSLRLFGRAQDVALESILKSGELAGNLRNADFDEQAQKARAQDTINAMNAQAARGTQQRNVGAINDAQQQNLSETQRIYDQNVNLRNQQEMYNKKIPQQMFENQMFKQDKIAGQRNSQINQTMQSGQRQANMWGSIGSTLLGAGVGMSDALYGKNATNKPMQGNGPVADGDEYGRYLRTLPYNK